MKVINLLLLFTILPHLFAQTNEEVLQVHTFNEVEKLQKIEKRPLVVFIHTDWCKFCFAMKNNTFTNARVKQLLNNHFYFISLNAEFKKTITYANHDFKFKEHGYRTGIHELAEALAMKKEGISYPTTVILDVSNAIDEQINTYVSGEIFEKILLSYLQKNKLNPVN